MAPRQAGMGPGDPAARRGRREGRHGGRDFGTSPAAIT